MKKIALALSLLLILSCGVFLSACDGSDGTTTTATTTTSTTTTNTTTTTTTTSSTTSSSVNDPDPDPDPDPHIHEFSEWTQTIAPTCDDEGEETRACSCGETETRMIGATGHAFGEWEETKAPACTEEGEETRICHCGHSETRSVDALGHTEATDEAKTPTCTEEGLTEGKHCSSCGEVLVAQETVDATGHTEATDEAKTPTCTETGLTEGSHCSVCGEVLVEQTEIPMVPHTYDDKYDETCNECGYIRDAECAHAETEVIEGKDATCTESGLTNGEKCVKCGEILVEQEIIDPTDHSFGAWVETTAPKCEDKGEETRTCHCGHKETRPVDATGHTFGEWVETTAPKCEVKGEETRTCHCGHKETRPVDETGHTEVTDEAKAPTCTEEGLTEGSHCSSCGKVFLAQETVSAAGHEYSDGVCIGCGERAPSEGLEFTSVNGGKCYVSGIGNCSDVHIVVPSVSPKGEPVIQIGSYAFHNNKNIKSVVLPESVEYIGMVSFGGCSNLESISMPGVYSIGSGAFNHCASLSEIIIPDGMVTIGESAFSGCKSLESIVLSDSVKYILRNAFDSCTSLKSIVIGNGAETIGFAILNGCTSLESITLPYIGEVKSSMNNIHLAYLFGGASYERNPACVPATLKNITITNISYIGYRALWGCSNIETVEISEKTNNIASGAFYGCTGLTAIRYHGTVEQWNALSKSTQWDYNTGEYTVYCTDGTVAKNN